MERLARLPVPSDMERYGVRATVSLFLTEVSDVLPTNPVESQTLMGYSMHMRGNAAHDLCNRHATMLSALNPSHDKIHRSTRLSVAAVSTQSAPRESELDHASEVAELRYLLRDAREPLHLLNTCDCLIQYGNTFNTQHRPGVAPPRYFAAAYQPAPLSLETIENRAATIQGQHGVPFLQ